MNNKDEKNQDEPEIDPEEVIKRMLNTPPKPKEKKEKEKPAD